MHMRISSSILCFRSKITLLLSCSLLPFESAKRPLLTATVIKENVDISGRKSLLNETSTLVQSHFDSLLLNVNHFRNSIVCNHLRCKHSMELLMMGFSVHACTLCICLKTRAAACSIVYAMCNSQM